MPWLAILPEEPTRKSARIMRTHTPAYLFDGCTRAERVAPRSDVGLQVRDRIVLQLEVLHVLVTGRALHVLARVLRLLHGGLHEGLHGLAPTVFAGLLDRGVVELLRRARLVVPGVGHSGSSA